MARLRSAGELEVSSKDQAETGAYFDTYKFRFHRPDRSEARYADDYWAALPRSRKKLPLCLLL